jgi:hypothetical protein
MSTRKKPKGKVTLEELNQIFQEPYVGVAEKVKELKSDKSALQKVEPALSVMNKSVQAGFAPFAAAVEATRNIPEIGEDVHTMLTLLPNVINFAVDKGVDLAIAATPDYVKSAAIALAKSQGMTDEDIERLKNTSKESLALAIPLVLPVAIKAANALRTQEIPTSARTTPAPASSTATTQATALDALKTGEVPRYVRYRGGETIELDKTGRAVNPAPKAELEQIPKAGESQTALDMLKEKKDIPRQVRYRGGETVELDETGRAVSPAARAELEQVPPTRPTTPSKVQYGNEVVDLDESGKAVNPPPREVVKPSAEEAADAVSEKVFQATKKQPLVVRYRHPDGTIEEIPIEKQVKDFRNKDINPELPKSSPENFFGASILPPDLLKDIWDNYIRFKRENPKKSYIDSDVFLSLIKDVDEKGKEHAKNIAKMMEDGHLTVKDGNLVLGGRHFTDPIEKAKLPKLEVPNHPIQTDAYNLSLSTEEFTEKLRDYGLWKRYYDAIKKDPEGFEHRQVLKELVDNEFKNSDTESFAKRVMNPEIADKLANEWYDTLKDASSRIKEGNIDFETEIARAVENNKRKEAIEAWLGKAIGGETPSEVYMNLKEAIKNKTRTE